MTKAQEIALLDSTIAKFGPDSYLGPWLAESRAAIVASIESDHTPGVRVLLPGAAYEQARQILAEAHRVAEETRDRASRQADDILQRADAAVARVKVEARRDVERAITVLAETARRLQ